MNSARPLARFATDDERSRWDALIAANPGGGEVWMGEAYLGVKCAEGRYREHRVIVERPGRPAIAVGVLAKRVPLLGEWWHLPAGPDGNAAGAGAQSVDARVAAVIEVASAVGELARSHGAFLLKIEPRLAPSSRAAFHAAGFVDTVRIIPNPSTVLVDVRTDAAAGSPEAAAELRARIGKKARNSISRAERDGIFVRRVDASAEHCAAFFELLNETAEGRFVLRSERYYREFWQRFERSGDGQLFFAYREDEHGRPQLLAGAFAMGLGTKTTYKDGASLRAKIAYGASHALQWEVLLWANERGAHTHDLCGAPPAARADDREHPLFGVGQFKRSFSSEITDYVGAFDLPLRSRAYAFWVKLGDRLARRASLALKKDPYY